MFFVKAGLVLLGSCIFIVGVALPWIVGVDAVTSLTPQEFVSCKDMFRD